MKNLEHLRAQQEALAEQGTVAGDTVTRELPALKQACEVLIAAEQEKILPDGWLIGVLCDTVRLARQYSRLELQMHEGLQERIDSPNADLRLTPALLNALSATWRDATDATDAAAGAAPAGADVATRVLFSAVPALIGAARRLIGARLQIEEDAIAHGVTQIAVTPLGYTQLPRLMLEALAPGGGNVWFVRGKERWEAYAEDELSRLLAGLAPALKDPPASLTEDMAPDERCLFEIVGCVEAVVTDPLGMSGAYDKARKVLESYVESEIARRRAS